MKKAKKPLSHAVPEKLAEAQKYLIWIFGGNALINAVNALLQYKYPDLDPSLFINLGLLDSAANVGLFIAIYVAARRLGFSKAKTLTVVLLSVIIPLVSLVLLLSANFRITRILRASGWKVGLLGARKA